jgi:DNA repair protein RecO (recombination protein O)
MSHERAYKTRAIVLRARNLGEADRIYVLFSQARGKIDGVAKGVRRSRSQLSGKLEFACEVFLTLHRGRTLDVITGADPLPSRWEGLVRPGAFAAAQLLAELIDAFCEPDLQAPEVYALLNGALRTIALSDAPASVVPRFQLRLLAELGLAPPDGCVRCDAPLDGRPAWADLDGGGLACAQCRPHHADRLSLDAADVACFRSLAVPRAAAGVSLLRPTLAATPAASRAIDALVAHHLGKRPKARALLDELVPGA